MLAVVPLRGHVLAYLAAGAAIAACTSVLLLAWSRWRRINGCAWVPRSLAALGVVSYGAYLWNYQLTVIVSG